MILLFLALHYLCGLASTVPTDGIALDSADGSGVLTYRTTAQIVTSCISTTLLCTWFTVHPNVYQHKSTRWQRAGRKLELFVWALLMPEIVMMWACIQWFGAREICKEMGKDDPIIEQATT